MLDATDLRILKVLQSEGRITNQALAKRCNMSAAACHERFRRLRDCGYIAGFTAILDPKLLDLSLLVFVEVSLDKMTNDVFDQFAAAARQSPEILECHLVAGGFDYLIKIQVKDMAAYRQFLATLVSMPGVCATRTFAVLEQVKSTTRLPI